MTSQIPDTLLVDGQEYSIAAINGDSLFSPDDYGLTPAHTFTACWRGWLCQYALADGWLVLDNLRMNLTLVPESDEVGEPIGFGGPRLNGLHPVFPNDEVWPFNNRYDWLNLTIPFTGRLLAGRGLTQESYRHMGFQPAWQYRSVLEVVAHQGQVTDVFDVSERIAAIREALSRRPLLPNGPGAGELNIQAWVAVANQINYPG